MQDLCLTTLIWFSKFTGRWNDRDGNTGIFNKNGRLRLHTPNCQPSTNTLSHTHDSSAGGSLILPSSDLVKGLTVVCIAKECLQTCSSIGDYSEVPTVKHTVSFLACLLRVVHGESGSGCRQSPSERVSSSPAVQPKKEPGFPLVGVETDTPFLTDPASSLEARQAHFCQQIHVGGELPICQVFCLGMHMFIFNNGQNTKAQTQSAHTTEYLQIYLLFWRS